MNRDKKDELPVMQVRFIDSICAPVYEVSLNFYAIQEVVMHFNPFTGCGLQV